MGLMEGDMDAQTKEMMDDFIAAHKNLDPRAHGMRASVVFQELEGQFNPHVSLQVFLASESSAWLAYQIAQGVDPDAIMQQMRGAGWLKERQAPSSVTRAEREGPGHVTSQYSLDKEDGLVAFDEFKERFSELFASRVLDPRAHGFGAMMRTYNQMLDLAPDKNPTDLLKNQAVFDAAVKNIKDESAVEGLRKAISKADDASSLDSEVDVGNTAKLHADVPKMG